MASWKGAREACGRGCGLGREDCMMGRWAVYGIPEAWLQGGEMERVESACDPGCCGDVFSSSIERKLVIPRFPFLVPIKNGQTCFLKHLECIFASQLGLGHGTVLLARKLKQCAGGQEC